MSSSDHFTTEDGVRHLVEQACKYREDLPGLILEIQRIRSICKKMSKTVKKCKTEVTMGIATDRSWFFYACKLKTGRDEVQIEFR